MTGGHPAARVDLMTWTNHKRSDSARAAGTKFISLRPLGIAFSATFVEGSPEVRNASRVSIVVDEEDHRLGFRFHRDEADQDAYSLTADGGGASGKWIQSGLLYREYAWLGEVLAEPAAARRFLPEFDAKNRIWFINVKAMEVQQWAKRRAGKR